MNRLLPLAALLLAAAPEPGPISPERLSADVKTLSSDAFEGRAPAPRARGRPSTISSPN